MCNVAVSASCTVPIHILPYPDIQFSELDGKHDGSQFLNTTRDRLSLGIEFVTFLLPLGFVSIS